MTSSPRPRAKRFFVACVLLGPALALGSEPAPPAPFRAQRLERDLLLIHEKAPEEQRQRLFSQFEDRVLAPGWVAGTEELARRYFQEIYEPVRRKLVGESGGRPAKVRERLGLQGPEEIARAILEGLGAGQPVRRIVESMDQKLPPAAGFDVDDRPPSPFSPEVLQGIDRVLVRWIEEEWKPDQVTVESVRADLGRLESLGEKVRNEPVAVGAAIASFVDRLCEACIAPDAPIATRLDMVRKLNGCLDAMRGRRFCPANLDARVQEKLPFAPRRIENRNLGMELSERPMLLRPAVVTQATLESVAYPPSGGGSEPWLETALAGDRTGEAGARGTAGAGREPSRPYYLLPTGTVHLRYRLALDRPPGPAAGWPEEASLILPLEKRLQVERKLPSAALQGRVYVYREDFDRRPHAYWVDARPWTNCEASRALSAYHDWCQRRGDAKGSLERIRATREASTLRAPDGTPPDDAELRGRLSNPGGWCADLGDLAVKPFFLSGEPVRGAAEILASRGGGSSVVEFVAADAEGRTERETAVGLPDAELAELLLRRGDRFGFSKGAAGGLAVVGGRAYPSPSPESKQSRIGISTVVRLKERLEESTP